ncbi:glucose-1-phosphate adenylyltransferase subunit GlgD [candidate division KSB1 bacterium]|nr:glucose-1-phosphate adenylyltransferase subunit GlgD [candidate division KSB1 bacterium]
MLEKILAMILAGGRVNELGVLTHYRPKSTVPFGGLYRVIDFTLSNLMHSGISNVGVLSQYRSASLISHLEVGAAWDFIGRNRGAHILPPYKGINDSDWYQGTADAIYQNLNFIYDNPSDLVLILSGDHIYKMDYQPLIKYHLERQADLTAVFKAVSPHDARRFGLAQLTDEDEAGGKIIAYHEKPEKAFSQWASLTIYLFNREVLIEVLKANHAQALKQNQSREASFHIGKDLIPRMLKDYRVDAYKFDGYWGYTQTIDEYWQANMDILDRPEILPIREWHVRTNLAHRNIRDRAPARFAASAQVSNSLVNNGCVIEGRVEHSILYPGVYVARDAVVQDSIIMFDTQIHTGARISRSILNPDVQIGNYAWIGSDCLAEIMPADPANSPTGITVIGEKRLIPAGFQIGRNCSLPPQWM